MSSSCEIPNMAITSTSPYLDTMTEFDNMYAQRTEGGTSIVNCGGSDNPVLMCEEQFDNASARSLLSSQADQDSLQQFTPREAADGSGSQVDDGGNSTPVSNICGGPSSKKCWNTGASKTRSNKGGSKKNSGIYADVMAILARPECSYTLLDELCSCLNSKSAEFSDPKTITDSPHKIKQVKGISPIKKSKGWLNSVKSLTCTGLLDGVPVNYVSATRKLPGIIKGTGYLCGCHSCKYAKKVTAYEFEHHAGCKTSHANDHIRLENGKSLFKIIQELKTYPESVLFEAIKTSIGFPIREEALLVWKESLQKANTSALSCNYDLAPQQTD